MKCLSLIFLFFELILSKDRELIFVLTHFRHGARAPIFKADSHSDYFGYKWESPSQLTPVGFRMHYILGLSNQYKYMKEKNFLSKKFDPHEVLIMSTDFNRTINSALAQLQGMYPLNNSEYSDKIDENQFQYANPPIDCSRFKQEIDDLNEKKMPLPSFLNLIPVHVFHNSEHRIKEFENPQCKNFADKLMANNIENKNITSRIKTFNDRYSQYFNKYFNETKKYDYHLLEKLADQFITDTSQGFNFATFKEKSNINESDFKDLYNYFIDFAGRTMSDYQYGDPENILVKLDVSPFFNELIEYINKRIKIDNQTNYNQDPNDYSSPKFVMISGHDSTLTAMMLFLGIVFKEKYHYYEDPIYASNAVFEVYRKETTKEHYNLDDYEVEYYYNEKKKDTFPLNTFIDKVKKEILTPEIMAKTCGYYVEEKNVNPSSNNGLFIALTCIFGIAVVVLFFLYVRKGKNMSQKVEDINLVES